MRMKMPKQGEMPERWKYSPIPEAVVQSFAAMCHFEKLLKGYRTELKVEYDIDFPKNYYFTLELKGPSNHRFSKRRLYSVRKALNNAVDELRKGFLYNNLERSQLELFNKQTFVDVDK